MHAQTVPAPAFAAETQSRALLRCRTTLWLALLTYPLVPWLLFRSAGLSVISPLLSGLCVLLSFGWGITGPVMAWLALCEADRIQLNRREHPQLVREAILAVVGWPFFVLSGAVLAWIPATSFQVPLWYLLLAAVAASRWLPLPQARPSPSQLLDRIHRGSALLLLAFGVMHVANHLVALESLQAHVNLQNMLRTVYRQPVVEVLIVVAALSQIWTGALLVSSVRLQRSTRLRNLQVLAGSFLGMFFLSHLTGVFISGRLVQGVDTTFAWATGGPHGLFTNVRSPQFVPYYLLAVLAFFLHAACAGRWSLAPMLGQSVALKLCYGIMVLGAIISLALLLPLAGWHFA